MLENARLSIYVVYTYYARRMALSACGIVLNHALPPHLPQRIIIAGVASLSMMTMPFCLSLSVLPGSPLVAVLARIKVWTVQLYQPLVYWQMIFLYFGVAGLGWAAGGDDGYVCVSWPRLMRFIPGSRATSSGSRQLFLMVDPRRTETGPSRSQVRTGSCPYADFF